MKKYLLLINAAIKTNIKTPSVLFMRLLLLILMITVFNQFWHVVKESKSAEHIIEPVNFLWYLLLGSILQYSRPEGLHKRIEDAVKSGDIAYQMMRPLSLISIYFFEGLGTFLIRAPFFLALGGLWVTFITHELPTYFSSLPVIVCLLFLSAIIVSQLTVLIGLSVFALKDSLPFFLVVQKCEYVLGGLFFPIIFYPDWLYKVALSTPFGWMGFGVTHLIYDFSTHAVLDTLWHLCLWIFILFSINNGIYFFIKRKVVLHG